MTERETPETRTSIVIASHGDHECRYNRLTRELFDQCGGELRYVCRGSGDTERDVASWLRWLRTTGNDGKVGRL